MSKYPAALIMDLPLSAATDYLAHAFELEKESGAWELWVSMYPYMILNPQRFISFEDFKKNLFEKPVRYTKKTKEEITDEIMAIREKLKGR